MVNSVLAEGKGGFIRAKLVCKTLENFFASADEELTIDHVPIWCKNSQGQRVMVEQSEKLVSMWCLQQEGLGHARRAVVQRSVCHWCLKHCGQAVAGRGWGDQRPTAWLWLPSVFCEGHSQASHLTLTPLLPLKRGGIYPRFLRACCGSAGPRIWRLEIAFLIFISLQSFAILFMNYCQS